jgi:hypothetical protein
MQHTWMNPQPSCSDTSQTPGFYAFGRNPPLAIVGGTGRFKGAQGDLNYVLNNSGTYSTVNLSFVTPNFGATVGRCDPTSQSPTQVSSSSPKLDHPIDLYCDPPPRNSGPLRSNHRS